MTHIQNVVDAVLEGDGPRRGKVYLFKKTQYVRFDWQNDRVDPGYPKHLSFWNLPGNFSAGASAALMGRGPFAGKAYFFRGDRYVRFDWNSDTADAGYPKPLSGWALPGGFSAGVDAAMNGDGPFNGKAYFFRGGDYVRFDWGTDAADPGYPKRLSAWQQPGSFSSGVTGAVRGTGPYQGKGYFFRGKQYTRHDWASDKPDPGYPRSIVQGWSGVHEMIAFGLAKVQALEWITAAEAALAAYTGTPNPQFPPAVVEAALKTHFHVAPAQLPTFLPTILSNYQLSRRALDNSSAIVRFRTKAEATADAGTDSSGVPFPGYANFGGKINFTESFTTFGRLCQAAMVLHESIHYVDSRADASNEFYEHGSQYGTITPNQAVHNASSYACFAQHVFYKNDERYGAGRPND